jgi:hypothetical protein
MRPVADNDTCDLWSGDDDVMEVPDLSDEEATYLVKGIVKGGKMSLTPVGFVSSNVGVHLLVEDRRLPEPHRFALLVDDLVEFLTVDVGWSTDDFEEAIKAGKESV